jgi:hypothetical protein
MGQDIGVGFVGQAKSTLCHMKEGDLALGKTLDLLLEIDPAIGRRTLLSCLVLHCGKIV